MKAIDTAIPDVKILEPTVFADDRGFFFESFSKMKFEAAIGKSVDFVQDNHSRSGKSVLRGLHYQLPPHAQLAQRLPCGRIECAALVQGLDDEVCDTGKNCPRNDLEQAAAAPAPGTGRFEQ